MGVDRDFKFDMWVDHSNLASIPKRGVVMVTWHILEFYTPWNISGCCSPDLADFHDLYISSDEKLFNKILTCPNHILPTLLPPPTAQNYSLRNRPHNRQLPGRISRITDCNFTVRMLYRNMYWLLYILDMRFVLFLCTTAVWQFAINEYEYEYEYDNIARYLVLSCVVQTSAVHAVHCSLADFQNMVMIIMMNALPFHHFAILRVIICVSSHE